MQTESGSRQTPRLAWVLLALLHGAALVILALTETAIVPKLAFLLAWAFFNLGWIVLLRRPVLAAALTLFFLCVLIALSMLKHEILLMTVNFVDLLLIDPDTFAFLMQVFPGLGLRSAGAVLLVVATLVFIWRADVLRVRRLTAATGALACAGALVLLAAVVPNDPWEEFYAENYFSKYSRSAVTMIGDLMLRGILEKDAAVATRLAADPGPCRLEKPPHIIMVHDESSFDIRAIPGVKVPPGYGGHFLSEDGKKRTLLVEGPGGPSWYTEYNMLTGLSARSFGRFVDFATRFAAGRIERGLPRALARCGYATTTLYPMYGSFLGAKRFQETAGIQHFLDSKDLKAKFLDPDAFYFNAAADLLARDKDKAPQFLLVYTAQNHFPWTFRYRPDLAPDWRDPGNRADVDEYLRRQHLTFGDYAAFRARLKQEFPDEPILIVRYGDHQPYFARHMIDPEQTDSVLVRRVAAADPRFLATYYSIEALNFAPRDLSSALDVLDAPYLPLVILEAAGVPLDPAFAEQKRILARCKGMFYRCNSGAEARRFNRLLIDAGLIRGL